MCFNIWGRVPEIKSQGLLKAVSLTGDLQRLGPRKEANHLQGKGEPAENTATLFQTKERGCNPGNSDTQANFVWRKVPSY